MINDVRAAARTTLIERCGRFVLRPSVLITLAVVWFAVASLDCVNFVVDDVFIPMRYAENIANGNGPVFNVGERVEGYSSMLWTAMLSGAASAGYTQGCAPLALLIVAKTFGAVFGLATILLLVWVMATLRSENPAAPRDALAGLAIVALPATFGFDLLSASGMETSMCAFFTTLATVLLYRGVKAMDQQSSRTPIALYLSAVVVIIGTMVRPEQSFVWGAVFAVMFLTSPSAQRRRLIPIIAIVIVGAAVPYVWRYMYYGQLVPNSVLAKSGGSLLYRIRGIHYLLSGVLMTLGIAAAGSLFVPSLWKREHAWRVPVLVVGAMLVFILVSGGDWMPGFRFFVPVLPLMLAIAFTGFALVLERAGMLMHRGSVALVMVIFLLGGYFAQRSLVKGKYPFEPGFTGVHWHEYDSFFRVAEELKNVVPEGKTIAISEAGIIPYVALRHTFFDLDGLMDAKISHMPGTPHAKLTAEYFFQRAPEYYLMAIRYPPDPDSTRAGMPVTPTYDDGKMLVASGELFTRYSLVKIMPDFALFKRNQ